VKEIKKVTELLNTKIGQGGGGGSTVAVPNEGSGVVQINGTSKAVVNFATDAEFEEAMAAAGLVLV
jgi:hypothetical protein